MCLVVDTHSALKGGNTKQYRVNQNTNEKSKVRVAIPVYYLGNACYHKYLQNSDAGRLEQLERGPYRFGAMAVTTSYSIATKVSPYVDRAPPAP